MIDNDKDAAAEDHLDEVLEVQTQNEAQTDLDVEAETLDDITLAPAPSKRGVGWGAVLPLFILAAAGGAAGGWALTQYVMPNYIAPPQSASASSDLSSAASEIDLAPLTARIEATEKKLSAQASQLSFLSSEIKSGTASVKVGGVDKAFDVSPLLSRIDALEAQLGASGKLETSGLPALSSAAPVLGEDGQPLAAANYLKVYENRLVTLEKSFAEVQALAETSGPVLEADSDGETNAVRESREAAHESLRADLEAMRARVSQLETDITEAQALAATPTIVRETVLLPPLPRAAMVDALTAPRDADSQGWLNRTLNKHISVRNPQEVARANAALDEIETLTAARDYAAALKRVEAMPSDVRSLAADWTQAVKAEVQIP